VGHVLDCTGHRRRWRREELIVVGNGSNWSNRLWTSTKPLPDSHPNSLDIKACHGERKEGEVQNPPKCWSLGWKCRSEGRLQPLNGKRRTLRPHVRTVVTCGEFCNVRRVQYRFDRRPRLTDGGLKSLFYVSGTCYCRRGWPGNERLFGMAPPPRVLFEPTRFVVYL
jgi:hypothetical protein